MPLLPGESSFSYVPSSVVPSSDPIGSSSPGRYGPPGTVDDLSEKDILRLSMSSGDPQMARQVLDRLTTEKVSGWCKEVSLIPSRDGGYVQVSWGGVNKFAVLQEVVLWAQGQEKANPNDHVSHRCANPRCKTVGHMVVESAGENNRRKNCLVHIACTHCHRRILVCPHSPLCIKYGGSRFADMDDFVNGGGICGISCGD
jgi:Zinc-binding loop region of homing endonuclease